MPVQPGDRIIAFGGLVVGSDGDRCCITDVKERLGDGGNVGHLTLVPSADCALKEKTIELPSNCGSGEVPISWVLRQEGIGSLGLCFCPGKKLAARGRSNGERSGVEGGRAVTRLPTRSRNGGVAWNRDLAGDVRGIKARGVQTIVNLLNIYELRTLGVQNYEKVAASCAVELISFPIMEGGAPKPEEMLPMVEQICERVKARIGVVIHCRVRVYW